MSARSDTGPHIPKGYGPVEAAIFLNGYATGLVARAIVEAGQGASLPPKHHTGGTIEADDGGEKAFTARSGECIVMDPAPAKPGPRSVAVARLIYGVRLPMELDAQQAMLGRLLGNQAQPPEWVRAGDPPDPRLCGKRVVCEVSGGLVWGLLIAETHSGAGAWRCDVESMRAKDSTAYVDGWLKLCGAPTAQLLLIADEAEI